MLAPIAFFAYRRPIHALRSLESLSKNLGAAESSLYVFCDGPRTEQDKQSVDEVRRVVKSKKWCRNVNIIENETNCGLESSIISGVTKLVNEYGKVIVIEDDLLLSPYFLHFMNESLERYANEETVMHVSGYMFNVKLQTNDDAVFLPFSSSWGWGMWERAWKHFQMPAQGYTELKNNSDIRNKFDINGAFHMLEQQMSDKKFTWDINWYLTIFLRNGLCLFPTRTLVANIGFDGSGSHGLPSFQTRRSFSNKKVTNFPRNLSIDQDSARRINMFFKESVPRRLLIVRLYNYVIRKTLGLFNNR